MQGKQQEAQILIDYLEKLHRDCRQQFKTTR